VAERPGKVAASSLCVDIFLGKQTGLPPKKYVGE